MPENKITLWKQALAELRPEIAAAGNGNIVPESPSLNDVLAELGQLPPEALFLGMAEDDLPVLLNLYDPVPGPLLVTGDKECGKTAFLKSIARVVNRTQNPQMIQYGVITPSPEDWKEIGKSDSCAGIIPVYKNNAMDFVLSLNSWAHANRSDQIVVLLLDGLDKVNQWNPNAIDDLRWLLMRGPARRVWPIVTLNPEKKGEAEPFLQHFRTIIYGKVADQSVKPEADLDSLIPGVQFTMKEGLNWLRFWIP